MLIFDLSNHLMAVETARARVMASLKDLNEQMAAFDRAYQQLKALEKAPEVKPARNAKEGEK